MALAFGLVSSAVVTTPKALNLKYLKWKLHRNSLIKDQTRATSMHEHDIAWPSPAAKQREEAWNCHYLQQSQISVASWSRCAVTFMGCKLAAAVQLICGCSIKVRKANLHVRLKSEARCTSMHICNVDSKRHHLSRAVFTTWAYMLVVLRFAWAGSSKVKLDLTVADAEACLLLLLPP